MIVVYRTTWATYEDTKELPSALDNIIIHTESVIVAGDFNLPGTKWSGTDLSVDIREKSYVRQLATEHSLIRVARELIR